MSDRTGSAALSVYRASKIRGGSVKPGDKLAPFTLADREGTNPETGEACWYVDKYIGEFPMAELQRLGTVVGLPKDIDPAEPAEWAISLGLPTKHFTRTAAENVVSLLNRAYRDGYGAGVSDQMDAILEKRLRQSPPRVHYPEEKA